MDAVPAVMVTPDANNSTWVEAFTDVQIAVDNLSVTKEGFKYRLYIGSSMAQAFTLMYSYLAVA